MVRASESGDRRLGVVVHYQDNLYVAERKLGHMIRSVRGPQTDQVLNEIEQIQGMREVVRQMTLVIDSPFQWKGKMLTVAADRAQSHHDSNVLMREGLVDAVAIANTIVTGTENIGAVFAKLERNRTNRLEELEKIGNHLMIWLAKVVERRMLMEAFVGIQKSVAEQGIRQTFGADASEASRGMVLKGIQDFLDHMAVIHVLRPMTNLTDHNREDLQAFLADPTDKAPLDRVLRGCHAFLVSRIPMNKMITKLGDFRNKDIIRGELRDDLVRDCTEVMLDVSADGKVGCSSRLDDGFKTKFVDRLIKAMLRLIDKMMSSEGCKVYYFKRNLRRFAAVH